MGGSRGKTGRIVGGVGLRGYLNSAYSGSPVGVEENHGRSAARCGGPPSIPAVTLRKLENRSKNGKTAVFFERFPILDDLQVAQIRKLDDPPVYIFRKSELVPFCPFVHPQVDKPLLRFRPPAGRQIPCPENRAGAFRPSIAAAIEDCISNVRTNAPEAQGWLAPRFSVGKRDSTNSSRSPVGTTQGNYLRRNQ